MMKYIKITKDYFKKLKYDINVKVTNEPICKATLENDEPCTCGEKEFSRISKKYNL